MGQKSVETLIERMLVREGGYVVHLVPGDRGGVTYAGVSRNAHPDEDIWKEVDVEIERAVATGLIDPSSSRGYSFSFRSGLMDTKIETFYNIHYWHPLRCGEYPLASAESIFDGAVNLGVRTATKLAQSVVGVKVDGVMGPKTAGQIAAYEPREFELEFSILRIARYVGICKKNPKMRKFLVGWISRTLAVAEEGVT